ncbi:MAG: helix-turn-helix domain-containing protein [Lautropia sp.]
MAQCTVQPTVTTTQPTATRSAVTPATVMNTAVVAPRDRAAQWREWIWRHFGGLESDLYGDRDFDGEMIASSAGDIVLTRLCAGRHRVLRSPRSARAGDAEYLKIVAPWRGTASVRQRGRTAHVGNGRWIIYDTTDAYAVDNPLPAEHLIVMVPKRRVAEAGVALEPLMGRQVGDGAGIAQRALESMRGTWRALPAMDAAQAAAAGDAIAELVRQSLLELACRATAMTQREALRDRIRGHVERHLRDPDLSVDGIAAALNCSRRHLYNAFAGEPDSIAGYIQRSRLEACIHDLQRTGAYARPITDIALSWGFGNLSHFSRVFREHTGASPRAFRSAAGRDSGRDR